MRSDWSTQTDPLVLSAVSASNSGPKIPSRRSPLLCKFSLLGCSLCSSVPFEFPGISSAANSGELYHRSGDGENESTDELISPGKSPVSTSTARASCRRMWCSCFSLGSHARDRSSNGKLTPIGKRGQEIGRSAAGRPLPRYCRPWT
jgi:hypothetical protein